MMPSEVFYVNITSPDQSSRAATAVSNSTSSLAYVNSHGKLRWGYRPKSSPSSARPVTSQQSSKIHRPKTAAVFVGKTECDRVHQLEHEPTRRHNLESHLPLKKAKPPPWQKVLEAPLVPFQTGPGYILTRSKTKCHVTIKDEFFDPVQVDNREVSLTLTQKGQSHLDPERDQLIVQLQQQISDLTLYLEEERLNHKQTKQRAEEFLRDKLDQLNSQHRDHVRDLESEHAEEMKKQKQLIEQEHGEIQSTLEKQISKMVKEIEFLQGAFESYKSTLHSETVDKLKAKEDDLRNRFAEEKQAALHDLKTKFILEKNQERANTEKEHRKAIDALRKENKREMDGLLKRFSNAAADMEKMKKCTAELEETKSELEKVKLSYDMTCQQLASTTRSLTDSKVRLMEFEERFQEKVSQVDDKYRHRLQELMTQNTELKRMFVQKCGELYNEKIHTDQQMKQKVKTVKETMEILIKSKHRADVSVVLGGPPYLSRTGKSRPLSAPLTREETQSAHQTAGNVELPTKHEEFVSPDINLDSSPKAKELRAELLSSHGDREQRGFFKAT
ncbi:unnamed protein product [Lymnaea stagnalis]|uniref:Uncharacterized protein n=1 Tax=Lymnaea stagnalis TaxID=6523 RepID=A0AAV2IBQ4_LYMST